MKRLRRFDLRSGDGRQLVVVVSVHGRVSLLDVDGLLHLAFHPVLLSVYDSLSYPWRHCDRWRYSGLLPHSVYPSQLFHHKFQNESNLPNFYLNLGTMNNIFSNIISHLLNIYMI